MEKTVDEDGIDALEEDYLYTDQSQIENAGQGLFAAMDIFKEEVISIFKGEILTEKESDRRIAKGLDRYFINLLDGSIMDSMNTECFAKFANDADGMDGSQFENNAEISLTAHDEVCIRAIRKIKAQEEIFCGYGKAYWKKHG